MLPEGTSQVKFEVSRDAAALIRDRGGQLWIWPSPHGRSAYATTEPPGETREWTDYRQSGFVVHVDDAIVPPERWAVALPAAESRHLDAQWMGADLREASARLPLVDQPDDELVPTKPRSWSGRFAEAFALAAVAWLVARAVRTAGIHNGWLDSGWFEGIAAGLLVALLVLAVGWAWRRVRRVDASAS